MSSEDFFWGSVTGASIERATNHLVQARESAERSREYLKDVAREKSLQKTFKEGSAKIDELRELLHVTHANKAQFQLGYRLLQEALKKSHPDAATIIADIDCQRGDLYRQFIEESKATLKREFPRSNIDDMEGFRRPAEN